MSEIRQDEPFESGSGSGQPAYDPLETWDTGPTRSAGEAPAGEPAGSASQADIEGNTTGNGDSHIKGSNQLVLRELGIPIDATSFILDTLERYNIKVPPEAGPLLRSYMNRAVVGHATALPAICRGFDCPFIDRCWIQQMNDQTGSQIPLPEGRPCPQEIAVLEATIAKLGEMLGLNQEDPASLEQYELVYELAANELLRTRTAYYLSDNPELFTKEIVGYSQQGTPIYEVKANPALAVTERLSKLVYKLREQLLATPRSQASAGKSILDASTKASKLRRRLLDLMKDRGLSDADFEVEDAE